MWYHPHAMGRVVVAGSVNVDLVARTERHPQAGETVSATSLDTLPGGKGANQALAAARAGATTLMIGCVGDDVFGPDMRENLRREGVEAAGLRTQTGATTGTALVVVDRNGENRIVVVPGALEHLSPAHVDGFSHRIAAADVLVVQLEIPLWTALYALEVGTAAGVRTILNPAPAPAEPIAPICDYVTPNESEAAMVAGARATVVRTLGEDGAEIAGERIAPFPAQVVDTTGAGDAFTAAFAVALAEGRDVKEAARWGCAAGAHMVEHPGVVPGLPTRDELERRLASLPV